MAVRLRFAMHGTRHRRILHLVAIDQRKRRNAKPIETLGVLNPRLEEGQDTKTVEWSVDRIKYWLGVGAQPSKTVEKLLKLGGVLSFPEASSSASPTSAPTSVTSTEPPILLDSTSPSTVSTSST
ncbi:hypothetical protein CERSUDRAFT_90574 [Gelatoporia subvermispora B]|uniref:Ribosomal protein S16 n=1 Tax=Ceriporiopsis subvermispora (strain B) TaxID=914234 RepID=M2RC07_CERS8|nr:hypothetical protein CERSUDRAFT_90574 [Gelatoporia subvermispora B]